MKQIFADRISDVPRSFIREILKVSIDPSIISFAGGLPNRNLFPLQEIKKATNTVLDLDGPDILQYSNSKGYLKLRQLISERYLKNEGIQISEDNIIITNGSQQGLDLMAKTILNENDDVAIEEPGYLGAIQALSLYKASFHPIPTSEQGMDINRLKSVWSNSPPKLIYTVPNFQNPSGISYSNQNRNDIADIIKGSQTFIIQDDPYHDLRFSGTKKTSFFKLIPENTVLLGSFSKTIAPSLRIGWIAAPDRLVEKLLIAKQASDLHTNYFCQRIIYQYLMDNDFDHHIQQINTMYHKQCNAMLQSLSQECPSEVTFTTPEGGMFLWVSLPEGASSMQLFNLAIDDKVAFVPGDPFYVNKKTTNTLRLNFSCVDEETIKIGIARLAQAMRKII